MKRLARTTFAAAIVLLAAMPAAIAQTAEATRAEQPPDGAIWVESIDLSRMTQRRGLPRAGRSIRDLPLTLGGVTYPHGIGTRSISEFVIDLKGTAVRFVSMVGLDDVVKDGVGTVTSINGRISRASAFDRRGGINGPDRDIGTTPTCSWSAPSAGARICIRRG